MPQFNPAIQTAMDDIAAKNCKRFTPQQERSVFCRSCARPFYQHTAAGRKFDSVMEMHRAYMSDDEVIKWLHAIGDLDDQIEAVESIINANVEVVSAPDSLAMQCILGCLRQLKIERGLDAPKTTERSCAKCAAVLEITEEELCIDCLTTVGADGAPDTTGVGTLQDICLAGSDDAAAADGALIADLPPS